MNNSPAHYCIQCAARLQPIRLVAGPLEFHCSLPCLVVWKREVTIATLWADEQLDEEPFAEIGVH